MLWRIAGIPNSREAEMARERRIISRFLLGPGEGEEEHSACLIEWCHLNTLVLEGLFPHSLRNGSM